jgi:hypothetical protein
MRLRVYLSGAIEHAADRGTTWRARVERFLDELGHTAYDPARDEKKDLTEEELSSFRGWKQTDPARFRSVIRKIISWDLDRIEYATDYVIGYWDAAAARGGGTAAEISFAHRLGRPVYVVLAMPVADASGWVLGAADEIFPSFEELEAALRLRFGSRST